MTSRRARNRDRKRNDRLRARAAEELWSGRPDRARRLLEEAIAGFPGNARYWYELGRLEMGADRPEEAARALDRALELRPDHAPARRALRELGVAPVEAVTSVTPDEAPEPPESLERTEPFDWGAVREELKRVGAARLEHLVEPALAAGLDEALAGRPGRPLEEGVSEHLLDAPPGVLEPWVPELRYRGRVLNRELRGLLSGPTPPAPERVVGECGVLSVAPDVRETRWPPAVGDEPFPLDVALPLTEPLRLDLSDAVGGKKGRARRRVEALLGDALVIGAGERAVNVGGVWGRQGLVVRVVGEGERRVLRVRVG